jgi:hypothetical protein
MSAHTQTIRVRIFPGIRMWQALAVTAAIVLSLLLGVLIGRSDTPAGVADRIASRDFSRYACTGHVPSEACRTVDVGYVGTGGHVPPGGFPGANGG